MAEWVILVLLVPAIVVPVVLLVGFAGCSFHGHGVVPPVIDSAIGELGAVTLTWHDPDAPAAGTFEIDRTRPDGVVDEPGASGRSSDADGGLCGSL